VIAGRRKSGKEVGSGRYSECFEAAGKAVRLLASNWRTIYDWSCENLRAHPEKMMPERPGLEKQLRPFDAIFSRRSGFTPNVPDHVSLWGTLDSHPADVFGST